MQGRPNGSDRLQTAPIGYKRMRPDVTGCEFSLAARCDPGSQRTLPPSGHLDYRGAATRSRRASSSTVLYPLVARGANVDGGMHRQMQRRRRRGPLEVSDPGYRRPPG